MDDSKWIVGVGKLIEEKFGRLQAENARLKEALENYGRHRDSCNKMEADMCIAYKDCDCGFDQALKEVK